MADTEIYQIFYSEDSRAQLDPGFLPLDNRTNEHPDWREYWPIRRFLLAHKLAHNTYYGFFSNKFATKTGLNSATVYTLIDTHGADADVITFSPYFEPMAIYLNIIEQGIACHANDDVFKQCAAMIAPDFQVDRSVMSSLDTVFCNYFVAKRDFWHEWLRQGERLFQLAEENSTPLARALNTVAPYVVPTILAPPGPESAQPSVTLNNIRDVPAKVFVIERIASLLLWSNPHWRVKSFNHLTVSPGPTLTPNHFVLNALKIAYTQTGARPYLETYLTLRMMTLARHPPITSPPPPKPFVTSPIPAASTSPTAAATHE